MLALLLCCASAVVEKLPPNELNKLKSKMPFDAKSHSHSEHIIRFHKNEKPMALEECTLVSSGLSRDCSVTTTEHLVINSTTLIVLASEFVSCSDATSGGCIYLSDTGGLKLASVNFINCSAGKNGGGIYMEGSSDLEYIGGEVTNCWATSGGLLAIFQGIAKVDNVIIQGCLAQSGGVFEQKDGMMTISRLTAENCSSPVNGGLLNQKGGECTISSSTMIHCSASKYGGILYTEVKITMEECAIFDSSSQCAALCASGKEPFISLRKVNFTGCNGDAGGAICIGIGTAAIGVCMFTNCWATAGGAIAQDADSIMTLEDSSFVNCRSGSQGGSAVWMAGGETAIARCSIDDCSTTTYGTLCCLDSGVSSFEMTNCVITNCKADLGAAVLYFSRASTSLKMVNVTCANCNVKDKAVNGEAIMIVNAKDYEIEGLCLYECGKSPVSMKSGLPPLTEDNLIEGCIFTDSFISGGYIRSGNSLRLFLDFFLFSFLLV